MNENERCALAAYRGSLGARQPEPARDWSRLLSKIEAGTQPMSVELEPPPRRRWIAWGLGAAAAVILAVWVWPRFQATQGGKADDASQAAYGAQERAPLGLVPPQPAAPGQAGRKPHPSIPEAPATRDDVAPTTAPGGASTRASGPARPIKKAPRSGTEPKPAAEVPKTQDVVVEAKALRAIRVSLRDQKADQALRLLRGYLSRFPAGVLRDEATLLRADALCMDGQGEKARGVASGFVRRHPKSPLTARARGVCREP